ncbi:AAA family ATPase [Aerococcaceae bacterium zg-BR9]|uniref:AAA family ATPase n=1 Tax=Aerococcaceae bacterium zg-1292 TaxID=2774330 RepID=UPI00406390D4|nr:AAA family ATPase [Aerococcaceae bacterium zg-BR9]
MKLESVMVENYRQFEKAALTFDEGITILVGANNSGKTSLITLIKNIFTPEKNDYSMSDIPAKKMQTWIDWDYPVFRNYIISGKTADSVGRDLVDRIIPQDNTMIAHLMNITSVRILVSYKPRVDDIKLFADYIMDLGYMKIRFLNILTLWLTIFWMRN